MTKEQEEQVKRLAERDASRADNLLRALDAKEARELAMLRRASGVQAIVLFVVGIVAVSSGCYGADARPMALVGAVAIVAIVYAHVHGRQQR